MWCVLLLGVAGCWVWIFFLPGTLPTPLFIYFFFLLAFIFVSFLWTRHNAMDALRGKVGKEEKVYPQFLSQVASECSTSIQFKQDRKVISVSSVENVVAFLRTDPYVQQQLHMVAGGSGKCCMSFLHCTAIGQFLLDFFNF